MRKGAKLPSESKLCALCCAWLNQDMQILNLRITLDHGSFSVDNNIEERKVSFLPAYNRAHSKSDITLNSSWSYKIREKYKVAWKYVDKEMFGTCYRRDDNWVDTWSMNGIDQGKEEESIYLRRIKTAWAKQNGKVQSN